MAGDLGAARNAYGFFDLGYSVRTELGGQIKKSFRLRHLAVNLHRAQESVSVRPAVKNTMFQNRKFRTRLLVTFLQKPVVMLETHLNEHFHDGIVKQQSSPVNVPNLNDLKTTAGWITSRISQKKLLGFVSISHFAAQIDSPLRTQSE